MTWWAGDICFNDSVEVFCVGLGTPGRRRKEGLIQVMLFPCVPCGRDVELGERGLVDCMRNLTLERIVER